MKTQMSKRSKALFLVVLVVLLVGGAIEVGLGLSWSGALLYTFFALVAIYGGTLALNYRFAGWPPSSPPALRVSDLAPRLVGLVVVVLFGCLAVLLLAAGVAGP